MTAKAKMAASPLLAALHDTATVSKWSHHVNLLYSLECVHIDSQLRSAAMEATKVGIREFRSGLAEYIAASGPVAVTRHGQTVGYFIPVHGQAEADMAALKKVSKSLDLLLSAQGVEVEDIVADYKKARRKSTLTASDRAK